MHQKPTTQWDVPDMVVEYAPTLVLDLVKEAAKLHVVVVASTTLVKV